MYTKVNTNKTKSNYPEELRNQLSEDFKIDYGKCRNPFIGQLRNL